MASSGEEPKGGSNNDIARGFADARRAFTALHREEVDRANFAQQRARVFRQLADAAGVLERFYSDDTVNALEAAGEAQFLTSASVSALSMGASGNHLVTEIRTAREDEERTLWEVASLQAATGAVRVFTVALGQKHGIQVPAPLDLPIEEGVEGSVEARVRELLGRVSGVLADQHAEAWRLFRRGTLYEAKAGQHLLRETFREIVQRFAPDDEVTKQPWYKRPTDANSRTTHAQRIRYIREQARAPINAHVLTIAEQLDKMEIELYGISSKGAHQNVEELPSLSYVEHHIFMTLYDAYMRYVLETVLRKP